MPLQTNIFMAIEVQSESKELYKYAISFSREGVLKEEVLEENGRVVYCFKNNILESPYLDERLRTLYSIETTSTILRKVKDFIPKVYKDFIREIGKIKICTEEFINRDAKIIPVDFLEEEKRVIVENKELALKILKQLDSTIIGIDFEEIGYESEDVRYRPFLTRQTAASKQRFSLAYDSKGIKRIMALLSLILEITKGYTICIDELDASISTRSLFLLFNDVINSNINQKGQLIVTTHNLELLDLDMFAPEQIYIVTKDERLFTQLNSLADFDMRNNRKRLSVSFLQGEFEV